MLTSAHAEEHGGAPQPSRALFTRPLLVLDTVQRALLFALAVGVVRSPRPWLQCCTGCLCGSRFALTERSSNHELGA